MQKNQWSHVEIHNSMQKPKATITMKQETCMQREAGSLDRLCLLSSIANANKKMQQGEIITITKETTRQQGTGKHSARNHYTQD